MANFVRLYIIVTIAICCVKAKKLLEYAIFEESPPNTFIGDVASDSKLSDHFEADVLENLKFVVMTQGNAYAKYFRVDEADGVLRTAMTIDRDEICPEQVECNLRLDIAAHSPPEAFQIIKVAVTVNDQNDHSPAFRDATVKRSIPEDTPPGTSFSIPTADDADSPKFGVKDYRMTGPVAFELRVTKVDGRPTEVHLVLKERVDREKLDHYRVTLSAVDGGVPPRTGSVNVDIVITDVNDNHPQFSEASYGATVAEDVAPGTTVLRVTALDKDSGANGEVVYGFSSSTAHAHGDVFSIDAITGDIVLANSLDYELTKVYNLVVTAREKNAESVPTEAKATIRVTDVNDNQPRITVNTLSATGQVQVSESASPGTFVALISVQDPDSGLGGQFQCSLGSNKFRLVQLYPTEFKLETVSRLDRENLALHRVAFSCRDAGTPMQTSSVDIAIVVLDENDNAPQFTHASYAAVVRENNDEGHLLMTVTAEDIDADDNGVVTYTLQGEAQRYIAIDAVSGNITARMSFDYEKIQQIRGTVVASDNGKTPMTSTVDIVVDITDVDDEAPTFPQPRYEFHVHENQPAATQLKGKAISAHDRDSFPFNEFVFSFAPNCSAASAFTIDPQNGEIFTRTNLDREEKDVYVFSVFAIDRHSQNLSTEAEVTVVVWDVNDHAPVIVFPTPGNSTVYVSSQAAVGHTLPKVRAYDNDVDSNARLTYNIAGGNEKNYFTIDETTGVISVRSEFRHRKEQEVLFTLQISVQDNGTPPKSAENASYKIIVRNVAVAAAAQSSFAQQNLTIVLAVAVVSVALIVILVVAIMIVVRQERRRKKELYLRKLFGGQTDGGLDVPDSFDTTDSDVCPGDGGSGAKEVSFSQEIAFSDDISNKYDVNWNKSYENKSNDIDPPRRPPRKHLDSQRHLLYNSGHYPPMPHQGSQLDASCAEYCVQGRGDSISVHSTETSNTDSGRGSNDDPELTRRSLPPDSVDRTSRYNDPEIHAARGPQNNGARSPTVRFDNSRQNRLPPRERPRSQDGVLLENDSHNHRRGTNIHYVNASHV
ncbi:hypothetical protein NP493_97g03029 [Ridgeia piscesae]|uniref:Cadherin domain-containing protein n=1 Tax=Ridgeia piscesae TaxID=27915 RepID=A0AAD9P7U3_RIDPI|nr:hypothetical protein NP493_97g03029 [Ridgeia piscesae]